MNKKSKTLEELERDCEDILGGTAIDFKINILINLLEKRKNWIMESQKERLKKLINFKGNYQLKKIIYDIDCPGDEDAGLRSYTDRITLEIDSGDPGGEEGEFEKFMKDSLKEWYDGANVEVIKNE